MIVPSTTSSVMTPAPITSGATIRALRGESARPHGSGSISATPAPTSSAENGASSET